MSFRGRDDELGFEASKPNPEDWSECMEFDLDFQEEFDKIISNPRVFLKWTRILLETPSMTRKWA